MTAEEWARLSTGSVDRLAWGNPGTSDPDFCGTPDPFVFRSGHGEYSDSLSVRQERRHALAALCLHGQPWGFTRDDVQALRDMPPIPWRYGGEGGVEAVEVWLNDLADRIEALLPPEGVP